MSFSVAKKTLAGFCCLHDLVAVDEPNLKTIKCRGKAKKFVKFENCYIFKGMGCLSLCILKKTFMESSWATDNLPIWGVWLVNVFNPLPPSFWKLYAPLPNRTYAKGEHIRSQKFTGAGQANCLNMTCMCAASNSRKTRFWDFKKSQVKLQEIPNSRKKTWKLEKTWHSMINRGRWLRSLCLSLHHRLNRHWQRDPHRFSLFS